MQHCFVAVCLALVVGIAIGSELVDRNWRAGRFAVKDHEAAIAKRKWRDAEPNGEAQ